MVKGDIRGNSSQTDGPDGSDSRSQSSAKESSRFDKFLRTLYKPSSEGSSEIKKPQKSEIHSQEESIIANVPRGVVDASRSNKKASEVRIENKGNKGKNIEVYLKKSFPQMTNQ